MRTILPNPYNSVLYPDKRHDVPNKEDLSKMIEDYANGVSYYWDYEHYNNQTCTLAEYCLEYISNVYFMLIGGWNLPTDIAGLIKYVERLNNEKK